MKLEQNGREKIWSVKVGVHLQFNKTAFDQGINYVVICM